MARPATVSAPPASPFEMAPTGATVPNAPAAPSDLRPPAPAAPSAAAPAAPPAAAPAAPPAAAPAAPPAAANGTAAALADGVPKLDPSTKPDRPRPAPVAARAPEAAPAARGPAPPAQRAEAGFVEGHTAPTATVAPPPASTTAETAPELKRPRAATGRLEIAVAPALRSWAAGLVDLALCAPLAIGAGVLLLSRAGVRAAWQPIVDHAHANLVGAIVAVVVAPLAAVALYHALTVIALGGTVGHRVLGLRVVRAKDGAKPGFVRALVRGALTAAGIGAFAAGPLWGLLVDRRRRGAGDLLTGSFVARAAKPPEGP
jgi:uncharacterized RDD family membrane protein YckC